MEQRSIVLVGSETLVGADVREILLERFPRAALRLAGSQEEDSAILTERGGEAVVLTPVDEAAMADARLVILAGSAESARRTWALLTRAGVEPAVVDLSYGLEDHPESRLRGPLAEPPAGLAPARLQIVAHPGAVLIATVLRAVSTVAPVARAVVTLLAPASEAGRAGVEELQQQTVQLLSFQALPQQIFGEQLIYNLVAGSMTETEHRIERHLATLVGAAPAIPLPSVRLIQSSVMHGYSASIWVELETAPEQVAGALRAEGLDVWGETAPNVVSMAGQNGIAVGAIEADRNNRRALWIWAVADNHRLTAENTAMLAEQVLG